MIRAEVSELLVKGGVCDRARSSAVITIGGAGDGPPRKYIAGNKAALAIRSKILEWETYKEMGTTERELCESAKQIMDARTLLKLDDTLEILRSTYACKNLVEVLTRRLDLGEFAKMAMRQVYEKWAKYLASLVAAYMEGAAVEKSSLAKLRRNWMAVDAYYGIASSSPDLLYSHFPAKPYDLPWLRGKFVEDDVWDVMPSEFKWEVDGVPETYAFRRALDASGFVYLGFCPRAPKRRLMELFKFPVDELLAALAALKIEHLPPVTLNIAVGQFAAKPPEIPRLLEPEGTPADLVKWYLGEFVGIYTSLRPYFESVEKYHTNLATSLSKN